MFDVCGLGDALVDMKPALSNEGKPCMEPNPGGTVANMLSACACLGMSCVFIGKVGEDIFGRYMAREFQFHGVDISGIRFDEAVRTTLSFVSLDEKGERSFSFYRHPGADSMLSEEEVDCGLIASAKVFHFSAMPLTNEPARSACRKAIRVAKESGCLLSCDVNLRKNLWPDLRKAKEVIWDFIRYADILKASEEELEFLTGCSDIKKAVDMIYDAYRNPLIVATLGAEGCYFKRGKDVGRLCTYEACAVDTTGAGDAFVGGMLYRLLKNPKKLNEYSAEEIHEVFDFANAAGTCSVTKVGSMSSMPHISDVLDFKNTARRKEPIYV